MTTSILQITAAFVSFGLALVFVGMYESARTRRLEQEDRSPLEQWQNPTPFRKRLAEVAHSLVFLVLVTTGLFFFFDGDLFLALFLSYFFALVLILRSASADKE
jgi:hypothetical protein